MMKKVGTGLLSGLLLSALLLSVPPSAQAAGERAVKTSGENFVDQAGRVLILRGVNTGGRSKMPPFLPFDPTPDFDTALNLYADSVAELGFNVVRLLVIWEAAEPERGVFNEDYLQQYDALVEAFTSRGIYVVVDAHQDVVSRRFCGDGWPDWALPAAFRGMATHDDCKVWNVGYFKPPASLTLDRFWRNGDHLQDDYAAFFAMLAARYRDNPLVIGLEPINEPIPGATGLVFYEAWHVFGLYAMYERVSRAVHEVDPSYLIFADISAIENTYTLNTYRPRPDMANLVLAPHYYDPGTFGKSIEPGGDQWLMRKGLASHRRLAHRWGVPTWVGEFGISPVNPDAPVYIQKLYEVLDELQLSGTFWEASLSETMWNYENTTILQMDGEPRGHAGLLDRAYPRAVAGEIESFSYDPESRRFEMQWKEVPATGVTEVYLPKALVDGGVQVTLEPDGPHQLLDETRTLRIDPAGGGGRRVMVVPAQ